MGNPRKVPIRAEEIPIRGAARASPRKPNLFAGRETRPETEADEKGRNRRSSRLRTGPGDWDVRESRWAPSNERDVTASRRSCPGRSSLPDGPVLRRGQQEPGRAPKVGVRQRSENRRREAVRPDAATTRARHDHEAETQGGRQASNGLTPTPGSRVKQLYELGGHEPRRGGTLSDESPSGKSNDGVPSSHLQWFVSLVSILTKRATDSSRVCRLRST